MKTRCFVALAVWSIPLAADAATTRVWICQGKFQRELLKINGLQKPAGLARSINAGKAAMNTLATFARLAERGGSYQSSDYREAAAGFRLAISRQRGSLASLPGPLKASEVPSPPLRNAFLASLDATVVLHPAFRAPKVIPIRARVVCARAP